MGSRSEAWIDKLNKGAERDPEGWLRVRGLALADAQELLDWLDCRGLTNHELSFDPAAGFTVRWRVPDDSSQPKAESS